MILNIVPYDEPAISVYSFIEKLPDAGLPSRGARVPAVQFSVYHKQPAVATLICRAGKQLIFCKAFDKQNSAAYN